MSIFGQVEYHDCCGIPLRKFGSLLVAEAQWFETRPDSRIKSLKAVLELARDIAVNESITEQEAQAIVQDLEKEEHRGLLLKYADRLDAIKQSDYTSLDFQRDVAVMMLNSRIDKKWLREHVEVFADAYDLVFEDLTNVQFTSDLVKQLPTTIIDAIVDFAANERNEWAELEAETADLSLGKS